MHTSKYLKLAMYIFCFNFISTLSAMGWLKELRTTQNLSRREQNENNPWNELERTWQDKINFQNPNEPINLPRGGTSTPLIMAAIRFNAELTKKLLDAGADPNLAAKHNLDTPLIETITMFQSYHCCNVPDSQRLDKVLTIVQILLNYNADPLKPNNYGRTALYFAENYDSIKQLLLNHKKPVGSVFLPCQPVVKLTLDSQQNNHKICKH